MLSIRPRPTKRTPRSLPLLCSFVRHEHGQIRPPAQTVASAKLFADAVVEEAEAEQAQTRDKPAVNEYPNWTGEESVQDAVLRMLVDKYKPLRGPIRTAEEKLKSAPPPNVATSGPSSLMEPPSSSDISTSSTANAGTHRPWLTTFRAPSHSTSIRHMHFPPSPLSSTTRSQGPVIHPDDSRARIEQRERKKKVAYAGRLTNARESSLDYRLGKTVTNHENLRVHHPNPVSIKGWTSLVEERIEVRGIVGMYSRAWIEQYQRARSEGHFHTIKGRGKPLLREIEESNPFIAREEFLMNRIVQRQGAAPPWVEIQGELEAEIASFRAILRSSWTRRAVRTLTLEHPPAFLLRLALADVTGARLHDSEWETRESSYHEEALREVNAFIRKYNGVAPYSVRRTFLARRAELDRMYEVSGADILKEIRRRAEDGRSEAFLRFGTEEDKRDPGLAQGSRESSMSDAFRFSLKDMWNKLVTKIMSS